MKAGNPDWSNGSQYKWFPYFNYKAGFGFQAFVAGARSLMEAILLAAE